MTNQNTLAQLQQLSANPLFNRAQQMAAGKTSEELQQVAKNLCSEKGINYDEAMYAFRQQFGF